MKKEDIEHLAKLSRIALSDTETDALAKDITSILGYVSEIEAITGSGAGEKKVGALYNVMREDKNPHAPDMYTEDILAEAPERDGRYVKVQKILGDKS